MREKLTARTLAWLVVLSLDVVAAGADWPQWRGPARDGTVGGPVWPSDLSSVEPLWRVELGKGTFLARSSGIRASLDDVAPRGLTPSTSKPSPSLPRSS